jgi:hypothetical protein
MQHGNRDLIFPPRSSTAATACMLLCSIPCGFMGHGPHISGWGASSVGRALRSQRRGRGFNSPALHQTPIRLQSHSDHSWRDRPFQLPFAKNGMYVRYGEAVNSNQQGGKDDESIMPWHCSWHCNGCAWNVRRRSYAERSAITRR